MDGILMSCPQCRLLLPGLPATFLNSKDLPYCKQILSPKYSLKEDSPYSQAPDDLTPSQSAPKWNH